MPATPDERAHLRIEFDGDTLALPDDWIDRVFDAAETEFPAQPRPVIVAAAYRNAARQLRNRVARRSSYAQGDWREQHSDLHPTWEAIVRDYEDRLREIQAQHAGTSARLTRLPGSRKRWGASE